MKISHQITRGIGIISIVGNLALDNVKDARNHMVELAKSSEIQGILLNCKDLDIIDSNGISTIALTLKELKGQKKSFSLCSLNERNMKLLETLSLDSIIDIYTNEEEALSSLL